MRGGEGDGGGGGGGGGDYEEPLQEAMRESVVMVWEVNAILPVT